MGKKKYNTSCENETPYCELINEKTWEKEEISTEEKINWK